MEAVMVQNSKIAAYINIYYLGHRRPKLTSRVKVND